MVLRWKQARPWYAVYEGEGEGEGTGEGTEGGAGDGGVGTGEGDETPKFSQKQVNKLMAENKRNLQKQIETQVKELEQLKKAKGLTDKDVEKLNTRIEDLNNSLLSKEELGRKNEEKLKGEHKRQVDSLSGERDFWKGLHHEATITRDITDEAVLAEAYNPGQIVAYLRGNTRLVEELDADGNAVPGKFTVKVKLSDTDKEGKPTTLDLSVKEALKRMKDRADEFGNFFKSGVTGGLGDSKNRSTGKDADPSKMTPAQYREWRKSRKW